jgi:Flp pilus assembly pilin Flp
MRTELLHQEQGRGENRPVGEAGRKTASIDAAPRRLHAGFFPRNQEEAGMDLVYGLYARVTTMFTLAREERGQTFAEYAVIIGIIAVALVAAVGTLRDAVIGALEGAANDI